MTTSDSGGQTVITVFVSTTQHTQKKRSVKTNKWVDIYTVTFVAGKLAAWSLPKPEAISTVGKFPSGSAVDATSRFTLCTVSDEEHDDRGQKGLKKWINSDIFSHAFWDTNKWTQNKCALTVHLIISTLRYFGASDKKFLTDRETDGPTNQQKHQQLS